MDDRDDNGTDRQRFLTIYLQDHRAGAEAGLRLAQRCHGHAPDDDTKSQLAGLVADIEDDRAALAGIMSDLDVSASQVKQFAGLAAERLGRLKLNGRAVRRSPLSILVELEGLVGAVSLKRELWTTLTVRASGDAQRAAQLDRLIGRADDQRARLRSLHDRVAQSLFAGKSSSHPGPDSAR